MNEDPKLLPILKQAVEGTLRHLPASLQGHIRAPWLENPSDKPSWKPHLGISSHQYRAILFPAKKPYKPRNFWNAEHCMYEIAIGSLAGILGIKVQMLFGGHRGECGKGFYVKPVSDILLIASKRRGDIRFNPNPTEGNISLVRVLPGLDPEPAAKDMAWIIAETFPKICAVQARP